MKGLPAATSLSFSLGSVIGNEKKIIYGDLNECVENAGSGYKRVLGQYGKQVMDTREFRDSELRRDDYLVVAR